MKILVLLAAVLAVYWILRVLSRKDKPEPSALHTTTQDMVACDYCGIHVPKTEALTRGNQYFCSQISVSSARL